MTSRALLFVGMLLSTGLLVFGLFFPLVSIHAWLAALFLWSGVPVGSLLLLMIAHLIGGRWSHSLTPLLEAGSLTVPLLALASLPVLAGMRWLYPAASIGLPGFRGAWLAPLPVTLRTLLFFGVMAALARALKTRRHSASVVSVVGLLLLVPLASAVAVDWIVALDRDLHSSGFGLLALASQYGVAVSIVGLILAGRSPRHREALPPLMITGVLVSLYLSFTSYFIIWSGNLAPLVGWYARRGSCGWQAAATLFTLIEIGSFLSLLLRRVRGSAVGLRTVAGALLLAKSVEALWLVLPQIGGMRIGPMVLGGASLVALGLLVVGGQLFLFERRIAARVPHV